MTQFTPGHVLTEAHDRQAFPERKQGSWLSPPTLVLLKAYAFQKPSILPSSPLSIKIFESWPNIDELFEISSRYVFFLSLARK